MGGQCPAIICEDADLATAVPALVKHAFANSGQFCYRVNRIYAQRSIYAAFVAEFAAGAERLAVGNGLDSTTELGPLINEKIFRTSEHHVADALTRGARLVTGGARLRGGLYDKGFFFPPTVLADTNHSMAIMTEETFGPVVGIMPVDTLEEAIGLANDSVYGLAGYVFSQNLHSALAAAESLEVGSVWVNNIHRSYHLMPFGGYKESGQGHGKIISISSATVFSGSPLWAHYVASKGAVIALTRVMAREAGDDNIQVNAIAPGFTLTEASLGLIEHAEQYGVSRGAIKRPLHTEDIVGAALFLASPASDFVTGQTIIVDGGKQFI
jgi:NAD(P)-dependent dehydrogenase (short-subunit alcohol dehydrogenase family)